MKADSHWAWMGGCLVDTNLLIIIGPMAMLAVAAGAPPASRDPLASASAPAMRRYRRDRWGTAASSVR